VFQFLFSVLLGFWSFYRVHKLKKKHAATSKIQGVRRVT